MSAKLTTVLLVICLASLAVANKPKPAAEVPNVLVNVYSPTQAPFKLPSLPTLRLPSFPTMRPFKMPTLPPFKMPSLPNNFYFPVRTQVVSRPATVTLPPIRVPERIIVQRVQVARPTMGPISYYSPVKVEYQDVPLQGFSGLSKLPPIKP